MSLNAQTEALIFDPVDEAERLAKEQVPPPPKVPKTGRINTVFYVAGKGNKTNPDIMFISPVLTKDETRVTWINGKPTDQEPEFLRCPGGRGLRVACEAAGVSLDKQYYTAVCKWLLPDRVRSKPKKAHFEWGMPALREEIDRLKPKVIVALGKDVFDCLYPVKFKLAEIEGGFFDYTHEGYTGQTVLMPSMSLSRLTGHPELLDKLSADVAEAVTMAVSMTSGVKRPEPEYRVCSTIAEVQSVVDEIANDNPDRVAVDCEWQGQNFVDGLLRSTQLAWMAGNQPKAVYIRFRAPAPDENSDCPYAMDADYRAIGKVLGQIKQPFCGHQISADSVWWEHVLGVSMRGRVVVDTLYGLQCVNEYLDAKLERLSVMFTQYGRYDIPLQVFKKEHKVPKDSGYKLIPDDILVPYAVKDVLVTLETSYKIEAMLEIQGDALVSYWKDNFRPFVTDVFTDFSLRGLYCDVKQLEETRRILTFARDEMEKDFQRLTEDREPQFVKRYATLCDIDEPFARDIVEVSGKMFNDLESEEQHLRSHVRVDNLPEWEMLWRCRNAPRPFNIRSSPQLRDWLFGLRGHTPLKSTGSKSSGTVATSWVKVLAMDPAKRATYVPAADKGTIQYYAAVDPQVEALLNLNLVGNLVKAFLREDDLDPNTGEPVKRNGLLQWVAKDGRIHGNFATTESGRPRSFNPNILNLPKYVNKRILSSVKAQLQKSLHSGETWFNPRWAVEDLPSVREHIVAPPGFCLVASDLKTAEIVALAYISGDERLIETCEGEDSAYELFDTEKGLIALRVAFPQDAGVNPKPSWIRKILRRIPGEKVALPALASQCGFALDEFERWSEEEHAGIFWEEIKPLGGVRHARAFRAPEFAIPKGKPRHDIHWELIEIVYQMSRELLDKNSDRSAGKVANFSSNYGATAASIERKYKIDTGLTPEEGMGQRLLDAMEKKWPVSRQFLRDQEQAPARGFQQFASGRIRHYILNKQLELPEYQLDAVISSLAREGRNFPMQHCVASVTSRAVKTLNDTYRQLGMRSQAVILLYDEIVTEAAVEELELVKSFHQTVMRETTEEYHGRTLRFETDTEVSDAWAGKRDLEFCKALNTPGADLRKYILPLTA